MMKANSMVQWTEHNQNNKFVSLPSLPWLSEGRQAGTGVVAKKLFINAVHGSTMHGFPTVRLSVNGNHPYFPW